jgi:hypothetical protein
MNQHSGILTGFLHGFKRMFEPAAPAPVAPAHGADERQAPMQEVKNFESALQQLRQKVAELHAAQQQTSLGTSTLTSPLSPKASPAAAQQTLEAVHNQVCAEILALHTQLQTHLTLEEIQHVQALMRELDAVVLGTAGRDMEQRLRAAAINRLVQECAPLAWHTLLTLMERAQVSWPAPTGLSPRDDERTVQAAWKRELAELEEAFVASSLERSADRALGVVKVWGTYYPPPDSSVWKRIVIQAVGCGILGYLLSVAVAKLRGDSADLTARVEHVLHEELATMQQVMQRGVSSVADADALIASTTHLCEEVVPTMAWETAMPDVREALRRFDA